MKYYSKKEIDKKKKQLENGRYSFKYDYPLFIIQEKKTTLTWCFSPIELIYGQLRYEEKKANKFYKFPTYVTNGLWELYDIEESQDKRKKITPYL